MGPNISAPPIITLTSDFGLDDPYVGVMKGVILQICPWGRLVDLSHGIPQGDIVRASLVIQAAIDYFPMGTVHLAVVDPGVGSARIPIVVHGRGMHFVGPDNGLFWFLADDDPPPRVVAIESGPFTLPRTSATFHGRDIFAPIAAHLASGVKLEQLGTPTRSIVTLDLPKPQRISAHRVKGSIIYVDHFGNCISNVVPEALGLDLTKGTWTVRCDVGEFPLRRFYSEVEKGAPLSVVGSSGRVELSLRDSSAAQLGIELSTSFLLTRID
jgi:S-adenosylmethionine hydrolase